jgi:hypothetical protein
MGLFSQLFCFMGKKRGDIFAYTDEMWYDVGATTKPPLKR